MAHFRTLYLGGVPLIKKKGFSLSGFSWRTTAAGMVFFLAIVAGQLRYVFDDDPKTNPDWNIIAAATAGLLGFSSARDNNKTSEMVGAK